MSDEHQSSLWQQLENIKDDPAVNAALHKLGHDLATPITVVGLNLELLKDELAKTSSRAQRVNELVGRVEEGHQKLQGLLKKLQEVLM